MNKILLSNYKIFDSCFSGGIYFKKACTVAFPAHKAVVVDRVELEQLNCVVFECGMGKVHVFNVTPEVVKEMMRDVFEDRGIDLSNVKIVEELKDIEIGDDKEMQVYIMQGCRLFNCLDSGKPYLLNDYDNDEVPFRPSPFGCDNMFDGFDTLDDENDDLF